jgi:hypothetical protein
LCQACLNGFKLLSDQAAGGPERFPTEPTTDLTRLDLTPRAGTAAVCHFHLSTLSCPDILLIHQHGVAGGEDNIRFLKRLLSSFGGVFSGEVDLYQLPRAGELVPQSM